MGFKKIGFTLAEVLITLTVVGIVATLTIPTLVDNVNKKINAAKIKNISASIQQIASEELVSHRTNDLRRTSFSNPGSLLSTDNFSVAKTYSDSSPWSNNYKTINGTSSNVISGFCSSNYRTVLLKSGDLVAYCYTGSGSSIIGSNDYSIGKFLVDINGRKKPNIIGKDVFIFYVTKKGRVAAYSDMSNSYGIPDCQNGRADICYSLLLRNNWDMGYFD